MVHRPQWCLLSTGLVDVRRAFQPERAAEAVNLDEYESQPSRHDSQIYISIEPFHLFRYLDEQALRFNTREASDAQRFERVLGRVVGRRLTYDELTGEMPQVDVGSHIVLLEPTPHSRPPTGASVHAQLSAVNDATLSYVAAMRKIAAECDVGVVRLFQPMLEVEQRLNGRTPTSTLYADEVHLNLLGDVIYSELVLDFLADAWR